MFIIYSTYRLSCRLWRWLEPDYLTLKNEVAFKLFFCPYGVGTIEESSYLHTTV
jgi:hypothetical protein